MSDKMEKQKILKMTKDECRKDENPIDENFIKKNNSKI